MNEDLMSPTAPARGPRSAGEQLRALTLDAKCLAMLITIRIGLSTVGYTAIRRGIPVRDERVDSHYWAKKVARRIERLARFVPGASCLTQALALQVILARAGHFCCLQIGVRRDDYGIFSAHAWVTCNGRVVIGHRNNALAKFTHIAELG